MSLQEITDRDLNFAIITVSDTRTTETDKGGNKVKELLLAEGHNILFYSIVKDDFQQITNQINLYLEDPSLDAIITTGGTGIAKRDVTIEAVEQLVEKEIPGFGEIFRFLSFTEDIGTKALASRAMAGVIHDKLVFALPGSVGAVGLGVSKLILPEVRHLVREINK